MGLVNWWRRCCREKSLWALAEAEFRAECGDRLINFEPQSGRRFEWRFDWECSYCPMTGEMLRARVVSATPRIQSYDGYWFYVDHKKVCRDEAA